MEALFIHYPKCTTCKKALKALQEQPVSITTRDITLDNPTKEELARWIEKSGLEMKKFFNTSGILYKEMQLKDKVKEMTKEEATALLATNGMLVKRPILVTDKEVLVGFKAEEYARIGK